MGLRQDMEWAAAFFNIPKTQPTDQDFVMTEASAPVPADLAPPNAAPGKTLSPEAIRALREAAERRALAEAEAARDREIGGPSGEEPTRFGDWERKGLAVDF